MNVLEDTIYHWIFSHCHNTYPEREEDDTTDEAEDGVLIPHAGDVVEDVDVVVHDPRVGVALVVRVDGHPQETLPLTTSDGEGRGRGEAGDHWHGDEVYQEAELEEAAQKDDDPGEEAQEDGVLRPVLGVDAGHQRHDGRGADGDVLAAAEHAVGEAAHEGGVEAVLGREPGHDGVGDALGDDGEADGEASDEVRDTGAEVIPRQPVQDWQLPA